MNKKLRKIILVDFRASIVKLLSLPFYFDFNIRIKILPIDTHCKYRTIYSHNRYYPIYSATVHLTA